MVFSVEDHILIENLYKCKGYGAKKLIREFPDKGWNVRGLNYLLKKLRLCETPVPQPGNQEVDDVGVHVQMKTLTL